MQFDRFPLDQAEGTVLAHGLKAGDVVFRKGRRLGAEDVARLRAVGLETVVAVRLDADDVAEDEAAARLRRSGRRARRRGGPRRSPAAPTSMPARVASWWSRPSGSTGSTRSTNR